MEADRPCACARGAADDALAEPTAHFTLHRPQEAGKDSFMTAQPERVNLERVLRPAMPSPAEGRQHTCTWRVVREDGSKASLNAEAGGMVLPSAKPSSTPAAAPATAEVVPEVKAADSATMTARRRLINLASLGFLGGSKAAQEPSGIDLSAPPSTSSRVGVGMPKVVPQISGSSASSSQASPEASPCVAGGFSPKLFSAPATAPARVAGKPRKPADPPAPAEAERDLQLMRVIDAWPALSPRARQAVVAVVEASCQR